MKSFSISHKSFFIRKLTVVVEVVVVDSDLLLLSKL